ncbi:MAG: hypothetical protein KDD14_14405 [Saprospiraceae bacterium]|nr:hypothetical protein [Saprospiraceae bacterium]
MKSRLSHQPWLLHLIYLLLLGGFIGYYQNQLEQERLTQKLCGETIKLAMPFLDGYSRYLHDEIEKNAAAYLNDHTWKYRVFADSAQKAHAHFVSRLDQESGSISKGLPSALKALADTLNRVSDDDPAVAFHIENAILKRDFMTALKPGALALEYQKAVLMLRARSSELAVLEYGEQKTGGGCGFDVHLPAMNYSYLNPKVGELFQAEVYLSNYFSDPQGNMEITVDGDTLSIREGLAHYKRRFPSAGRHTLEVQINLQVGPEIQTYTKLFEVNVLPR